MKVTLDYILYTQSPTLFLGALILLIAYFLHRKEHAFRCVMDLIGCIACLALGVTLYFAGIDAELFTIKDFWHIRTPAWIGMALVLLCAAAALLRSAQRFFRRRAAERSAQRSEREHKRQLEDIWKDAYASGMADAMAADSAGAAAEGEKAAAPTPVPEQSAAPAQESGEA